MAAFGTDGKGRADVDASRSTERRKDRKEAKDALAGCHATEILAVSPHRARGRLSILEAKGTNEIVV